jgi:hypothetical protein
MKNIFLNGFNYITFMEQKTGIESQINQLVYELYELMDEEIAIVEGSVNNRFLQRRLTPLEL